MVKFRMVKLNKIIWLVKTAIWYPTSEMEMDPIYMLIHFGHFYMLIHFVY